MDRNLSVRRIGRQARMRLDIALMHRLRGVAAFDDDVGFLEAGFNITLLEADDLGDVGRLGRLWLDARGEEVIVQDRRAGSHRVLDVDHERQHLVLNVDEVERLIGDRLRGGGDGGNRMAFIQRLPPRHDVARQITKVHRAFANERLFRGDLREVVGGQHSHHARQSLGLAGVDRYDIGMCVRAALDLAPQHAGGPGVGGEQRAAGDLVHAIRTDRPRADNLQIG
jgi:hypothetical protein